MAKNKQFNKNVKKQDSKSLHSVIPKRIKVILIREELGY